MAINYADSPLVFMCSQRDCHFICALAFDELNTLTPSVRKFLYWNLSDVDDSAPDLRFYWDETGIGKIALGCKYYDQVQVIYICHVFYGFSYVTTTWEDVPSSVEIATCSHATHALTDYKEKWSASNSLITDALFTN